MMKLTMTEFKALADDAAKYSAYDDAMNMSIAARSAQADAMAAHEQAETEKAKLVADHATALAAKDTVHAQVVADATAPLHAKIAELQSVPDPIAAECERQRQKNLHRDKLKPKE